MCTELTEMNLDRDSFDLICSGQKKIEVRVNDTKRKAIKPGWRILFKHGNDIVMTRVVRITSYRTFDEMLSNESLNSLNPGKSYEEQSVLLRKIYPSEREQLGVLAIEVEL